jgi:hypothetical protein
VTFHRIPGPRSAVLKSAGALVTAVVIVGCASSDGGSADTTSVATDASEATSTSTAPPETAPPTVASTIAPTTTEEPVAPSIPAPEATTVGELLALDRPVMLAHAGGDFDGPHSTLFAFTEAVIAGIDALEMDVRLSSDGVLMAF